MSFPTRLDASEVANHFSHSLMLSRMAEEPYRRWLLTDVLPASLCIGLMTLPISPPRPDPNGVRDTDNSVRTFLTPELQAQFPACAVFAEALQKPAVARVVSDILEVDVEGSYLRMEYIQDTDGSWLEPHCDIPEKLFSMVIYLCTGPEAKDWGTDIYDSNRRWIGRSSAELNSAVVFKAGPNTWHGFEPRPIRGVRRLFEINYVSPTWRSRDQLSFPENPITAIGAAHRSWGCQALAQNGHDVIT